MNEGTYYCIYCIFGNLFHGSFSFFLWLWDGYTALSRLRDDSDMTQARENPGLSFCTVQYTYTVLYGARVNSKKGAHVQSKGI